MAEDTGGMCQKPRCHMPHTETYEGRDGNELQLCERHYYKLVSRSAVHTIDTNSSTDRITQPFWELGESDTVYSNTGTNPSNGDLGPSEVSE